MKTIEQKVINFIQLNDLIQKKDKLLIALSGGADSVFALHFFYKFKKKFNCSFSAVHFNHNLRGVESDNDEKFVKNICNSLGIELFIIKLNVRESAKKNKMSIEEAARELRYFHLNKLAEENNFTKIVTAHNKNDNTETILQNLFSGTGIKGLTGIPIQRGKIIRPILSLEKNEIVDYLTKHKIRFITDSSNFSNEFKRNYLRNEILPLIKYNINPSVDDALFRFAKNVNEYFQFENVTCENLIKHHVKFLSDRIEISLELKNIYGFIPGVLLKKIFEQNLNVNFGYKDFEKINDITNKQKGKSILIRKHLQAIREKDSIILTTPKKINNEEIKIKLGEKKRFNNYTIKIEKADLNENFSKNKNTELISFDDLEENFLIRYWKDGDKFKPLGLNHYKKVSDFLTDLKIPSNQKRKIPVLINRNKIVWVIGLRISDEVKITKNTKRAIKLCLN
ncbi:MAG: tRNA lysidine(34) synthetase TilS [Melioribacteraceae bacterium]|nr:tRNA lysidine(34) synthetase TilS [Melioribacteraceae bacterium]